MTTIHIVPMQQQQHQVLSSAAPRAAAPPDPATAAGQFAAAPADLTLSTPAGVVATPADDTR